MKIGRKSRVGRNKLERSKQNILMLHIEKKAKASLDRQINAYEEGDLDRLLEFS